MLKQRFDSRKKMLQTIMDTIKVSEETIFGSVSKQAAEISQTDPLLKRLMEEVVLSRQNLWEVLAARISRKLGVGAIDESEIYQMFLQTFLKDESMRDKILRDISAIKYRDPACSSYIDPIMYFKGFHAITTHRVSHALWNVGMRHSAYYLQSLASDVFGVDIHPAAKFGGGILLDHATSFVAGETSVVDDNVSILHEVTLGGTGNETGDRHPKVQSGVLIGAGAKLIGNITIGKCAKIGAGSVVLDDVPPHTTVAGVPARPISPTADSEPALEMNQKLD